MDICSWRRKWQPTPVLLPGKSHGQRSLVGYNPWGPEVGQSNFHFHHFTLFKEATQFYIPTRTVWGSSFPHPHQYLLFPIKIYTLFWIWIEGYYAKWISQRQTNTVRSLLYVESKKHNKLVNITKKKQTHRWNELVATRGLRERWATRMGCDARAAVCTAGYKGSL